MVVKARKFAVGSPADFDVLGVDELEIKMFFGIFRFFTVSHGPPIWIQALTSVFFYFLLWEIIKGLFMKKKGIYLLCLVQGNF